MLAINGNRNILPAGKDGMKKFVWEGNPIRFKQDDRGDLWFLFIDLCKALGLRNPSDIKKKILKGLSDPIQNIDSLYFKQVSFSNARGYMRNDGHLIQEELVWGRLIARSNKPAALRMQRWIGSVIKQVLHTGSYALNQQLRLTMEQREEEISVLEQDLEELAVENEDIVQQKTNLLVLGCFDNIIRIRNLRYDPNLHWDSLKRLCNHLIGMGTAKWVRFGLRPKPYFKTQEAMQGSMETILGWNIPTGDLENYGFLE